MSGIRDDMLELVLGYEELDPEEKARADRALAADPDLARRVQELRAAEQAARRPLPLGAEEAFWQPDGAVSVDRSLQAASLRALQRRVGADRRGTRWNPVLWVMPLAAALALAVAIPRWTAGPEGGSDLQVVRVASLLDGTRSAQVSGEPGVLRSGDAVALDFRLDRASYVVFCLVDAEGEVTLIVPDAASGAAQPFASGRHTYPDPAGSVRWILNDTVGEENFLVGIREDGLPDTLALGRSLEQLAGRGDREFRVAEARRLLGEACSEVMQTQVTHAD